MWDMRIRPSSAANTHGPLVWRPLWTSNASWKTSVYTEVCPPEVSSGYGCSLTDDFHIDPIRIEDIRGVIVGMVVEPDARPPIANATSLSRRAVKGIDNGSLTGSQGDMGAGTGRLVVMNP